MQQQPRPFKAVARCGAIGAETVRRVVVVVLAQRLPVAVKMLDHQVVIGGGMAVDHTLDNALRTAQPAVVVGDIGQGEKGFGGVHVAVGATIGFLGAPVAIEGLAHRALFFAPEVGVDNVDGIIEQRLCAGTLRHHRGTRGQRDKGMQVGVLAGVAVAVSGHCKPAPVHRIAQRPAQGFDTVIDQFGKSGQALNVGHGKAVGHARGVHGFGLRVGRQMTALIEIAEAFRQLRSLGERQHSQAFGSEPLLVCRCVQPTAESRLEGVHGRPFLLL
ncbi:hypothetical protein D3C71_1275840 [compost metagenome]